MLHISETDKAYIAGLFDGEGCVGYYNASRNATHRPGYFHTSVHICGIDPRPIYWLVKTTGIGNITTYKGKGKRRLAYQWQVGQKDSVIAFLSTIRSYLKVKGDQVDVILAHLALEANYVQKHGSVTPEIVKSRQIVSDRLKEMKRVEFLESVETGQVEPLLH